MATSTVKSRKSDNRKPTAAEKRAAEFDALYTKAHQAGMEAGVAHNPTPMTVVQRANPLDDTSPIVKVFETVADGMCGFAWVNVNPGNSALAKYLKANGYAHTSYAGGVDVWVGEFNQSMERKEAYARAFAAVLREAGYERVYAQSRLD